MPDYHDYTGIIHVHSTFSDGLASMPKIIRAARQSKCSFLLVSDHNNMKALNYEGLYNDFILLVGEEITVKNDRGHYLAAGHNSEIKSGHEAQKTIDSVNNQGGVGFIAHPYYRRLKFSLPFKATIWQDWNVTNFQGMEIWNYTHDWTENFALYNCLSGLIYPDLFIGGPVKAALKKWDNLLINQKVVGIGSIDAHGYFYSYNRMFKTLHTHILCENPLPFQSFIDSKKLILQCLKKGNCYISQDNLAHAYGFTFTAMNRAKKVIMGDEISRSKGVVLEVNTPYPGLIKIIKNNKLIASSTKMNKLVTTVDQPGAYRTEVYLYTFKGMQKLYRPWIYSNPIYVY